MADDGPQGKKRRLGSTSDSAPSQPGIMARILACQRCRNKKIKCDQTFPQCTKCSRAGITCVGIDRATGREVPRSYVYHLEERVHQLESQLNAQASERNFHNGNAAFSSQGIPILPSSRKSDLGFSSIPMDSLAPDQIRVPGSHLYMGASLGVTFAKMMMAAVKMNPQTPSLRAASSANQAQSAIKTAVLPPKATAQDFIRIYFAQSNSQLPIMHREEFLTTIFEPVYGTWDEDQSPADEPFSKATVQAPPIPAEKTWFHKYKQIFAQVIALGSVNVQDPLEVLDAIKVPEEYHRPLFYLNVIFAIASSVNHLQYQNSISEQFRKAGLKFVVSTHKVEDPLEQLQTTLLLALYSLMRPCVPGVWYVLGQALRICVDLGLHSNSFDKNFDAFMRDRRRRLFWCTYSLDRQVCFYMGRPVGIPESSIKTEFPSELDDAEIVENATVEDYNQVSSDRPSYKAISFSFFRVRQIQLEVQRILYEGEELPRCFQDLDQWRRYIIARLEDWWASTPVNTRAAFHKEFFVLNYNHTMLMINGLSPRLYKLSLAAFLQLVDCSVNLLKCYAQLYAKRAVNYTWAAVHNLFMAGTSFLFALYHCEQVREKYNLKAVMRLSEECISVLNLLVASCDAAKGCCRTIQLLTAAVLKLRYDEVVDGSTIGFEPKPDSDGEEFNGSNPSETMDPKTMVKSEDRDNVDDEPRRADDVIPRFEWVSRRETPAETSDLVSTPDVSTFNFQGSNLDDFFLEVANLSPQSSGRESIDVMNSADSDFRLETREVKVPAKDGKRVYELIQQVPMESIWDQFFTVQRATGFATMYSEADV